MRRTKSLHAVDEPADFSWTDLAVQADVEDIDEFIRCAEAEASMERIEEDFEAATELGIYDTPTILLDSLLFTGSPGVRYLDAYIRRIARKEGGR